MRKRLTFANITAFLALFVALSGASYAAASLPAASVGAKQLKTNAVTSRKIAGDAVTHSKIAAQAVTGAQVAPGSLTGADINLTTLGKVPSAAVADSAGVARVKTDTATGTAVADSDVTATATCDPGLTVVGGGAEPGQRGQPTGKRLLPVRHQRLDCRCLRVAVGRRCVYRLRDLRACRINVVTDQRRARRGWRARHPRSGTQRRPTTRRRRARLAGLKPRVRAYPNRGEKRWPTARGLVQHRCSTPPAYPLSALQGGDRATEQSLRAWPWRRSCCPTAAASGGADRVDSWLLASERGSARSIGGVPASPGGAAARGGRGSARPTRPFAIAAISIVSRDARPLDATVSIALGPAAAAFMGTRRNRKGIVGLVVTEAIFGIRRRALNRLA